MATFRAKALSFLAIAGMASACLVGVAAAADSPAPSPDAGAATNLIPATAAILLSSAAFFGALLG
ncbi:hypothetical protein KSP39_PZI005825 [Platanthera zijinensis]|uniref:Uncharacterized protein n=1 Tax=Platanthera zijinensis TaxID=2320716 RepID=A0AAP0BQZ6_9ASPA